MPRLSKKTAAELGLISSQVRKIAHSTPQATLAEVRRLIADRRRWTKNAFGRDASNNPVEAEYRIQEDILRKHSVCACVAGMIIIVGGPFKEQVRNAVIAATDKLFPQRVGRGVWSLPQFNDSTSTKHAHIMTIVSVADAYL